MKQFPAAGGRLEGDEVARHLGYAGGGAGVTLPAMKTDAAYELLRQFASPIVAITSSWQGRTNGMISDSAVRASISPSVPRLSVYIHKWHLSHYLIWESGRFALHLLHRDQLDVVHALGFVSGRDQEKLTAIPHAVGKLGLPILEDRVCAFEMRVLNSMDAGYATHFLGHVEAIHPGRDAEILTPAWFRENMPPAWQAEWQANYRKAQEVIEQHQAIEERHWTGPVRP
jgi:flavin reductase (DIM6/NTAB) family NADH-FMN oxidoreductase RutF